MAAAAKTVTTTAAPTTVMDDIEESHLTMELRASFLNLSVEIAPRAVF